MAVILAEKTLAAIEAAMSQDGGAQFRLNCKELLPKMEDAYRGQENPFRSHLGASMIGRDCPRELAYGFRWAGKKEVPPRLQRLFQRGHLEEARFLAMLLLIPNIKLWYETPEGGQFRLSDFGGHFGSALDGVANGIPDLPIGAPCYTEFKTSAKKGFDKLVKSGMQNEKYEHYVQCQVCMHKMQLPFTLYMVVCKDTDELYAEIIAYDQDTAQKYIQRAGSIIFATALPPKCSESPTWFKCKWCDWNAICHNGQPVLQNCRTCAYAKPEQDGSWSCGKGREEIKEKTTATQGCDAYTLSTMFQ